MEAYQKSLHNDRQYISCIRKFEEDKTFRNNIIKFNFIFTFQSEFLVLLSFICKCKGHNAWLFITKTEYVYGEIRERIIGGRILN